jgi:hypothetical protein
VATFSTVINCIDGRIQAPVFQFLQERFSTEHVDTVTEAGIVMFLAEAADGHREMIPEVVSTLRSVNISVDAHQSKGLAVVAHSGCARNSVEDEVQQAQLQKALGFLKSHYPSLEVIALWVDISGEQPQITEF